MEKNISRAYSFIKNYSYTYYYTIKLGLPQDGVGHSMFKGVQNYYFNIQRMYNLKTIGHFISSLG